MAEGCDLKMGSEPPRVTVLLKLVNDVVSNAKPLCPTSSCGRQLTSMALLGLYKT
jgi:hypothetical protein